MPKRTLEEQKAVDVLVEAARVKAGTTPFFLPDENGSKFLNHQKMKESAILVGIITTIIAGIILGTTGWFAHRAVGSWDKRDAKMDVIVEGMVMMMEGQRIQEGNLIKMIPRMNTNTKFIHDHIAKNLPYPQDIELKTYWQEGRIGDFLEKIGKCNRKD